MLADDTFCASGLNQVEHGFGLIVQRALKRNSFRHVQRLRQTIEAFTQLGYAAAYPILWTAHSPVHCGQADAFVHAPW